MTVKTLIKLLQQKCKDDTQFGGKTVYYFNGNEEFSIANRVTICNWLRNAVIIDHD